MRSSVCSVSMPLCWPPCSCNSVAFAGSIFVRSREEQQFVRERGPLHVLTATGFPW